MAPAPNSHTRVYTIPSGSSFIHKLACGLLERGRDDPLALAAYTIFLPTRRGCVELKRALLHQHPGEALLLPRLIPLGEIDSEEEFIHLSLADPITVIPPFKRLGWLCQLILTYTQNSKTAPHNMESALLLSKMLITLMDQATIEEISWETLADLVPEDFASHWQITLDFLAIIREHWPRIMEASSYKEPQQARALTLDALIKRLKTASAPFIVAGSTGTMPATARLIKAVAHMDQGEVILPGLDVTLDEEALGLMEVTHPQYASLQLLKKLGLTPREVAPWPAGGSFPDSPRAQLFRDALDPSGRRDHAFPEGALEGLQLLEVGTRHEEALSIALLLREVLEDPTKTGALITPDRKLARQVAMELKRWHIIIDDSAGELLNTTPSGIFLRLILDVCVKEGDPVALLSLLKNPFVRLGKSGTAVRKMARSLEKSHLRGLKKNTLDFLKELPEDHELREILHALEPLGEAQDLTSFIRGHLAAAEALALEEDGTTSLWTGPRGQKFQQFFMDLLEAGEDFPPLSTLKDYQELLEILLQGQVTRPHHQGHPRLKILGPIEARLYQADRVILGGLNEGLWPPEMGADPWLSRPMREKMGFPPIDRRVGLSAHDFGQAFASGEVYLTRSLRSEGTPTIPSRWLASLEVHLKKFQKSFPRGDEMIAWARSLDQGKVSVPSPSPRPSPPLEARPRTLPVTAIETWMRDPYALYAKYILGLRALDDLGRPLGPADRGNLIHRIFERFVKEGGETLEDLLAMGREEFAPHWSQTTVQFFWWPRFYQEAQWFFDHFTAPKSFTEVKGAWTLPLEMPFTLTAKADRIDVEPSGALRIIDYKTGQPPSQEDVRQGFSPQLTLEGLIGSLGTFEGIGTGAIEGLEFWHIKGQRSQIIPLRGDVEALMAEAHEGLLNLIALYEDPTVPYLACPRPHKGLRYNDYDHLARRQEWQQETSHGAD